MPNGHGLKAATVSTAREALRRRGNIPLVCVRPPGWTHASSEPARHLLEWVERAEELAMDGVFVGDRMLAKATERGNAVYAASMLDVTVMLSSIAARTSRMLLGSLVMVLPFRHPVQLAKSMASLDVVSDGRLVLGAGLGWNTFEFHSLGLRRQDRARDFEDSVRLLRQLWSGEPTSHVGSRWVFEDVQISPLPRQTGGPPIWMASFAPSQSLDWAGRLPEQLQRQLDRVGRLADGWVPLVYSASAKRRILPETLALASERVQASAQAEGRSPDSIDIVLSDWGYILDGRASRKRCEQALAMFFEGTWEDALRTYTIGTTDQVYAGLVEMIRALGGVNAVVWTPFDTSAEQLDLFATTVAPRLRQEHARLGRPHAA